MDIYSYTILVTEECNFSCSYCYQKKGSRFLEIAAVKDTIDCLLHHFAEESYINFSGGEPLLAFELIKDAVEFIKEKNSEKNIRLALTTNGSLIDEKILSFLRKNQFSLMLSFDGLAQNFSRREGSQDHIVSIIKKLLTCPEIKLEIHSVFTPMTVRQLYASLKYIFDLGVQESSLSFSYLEPWDKDSLLLLEKELARIRSLLFSLYKKNPAIPLIDIRAGNQNRKFQCTAGRDRMALSADGRLWGCYLMADYFRGKEKTEEYQKYCFGRPESFQWHQGAVKSGIPLNYLRLSGKYYTAFNPSCRTCPEADDCVICPMNVAFSRSLGSEVPNWMCEIKKIFSKEKKAFLKQIEDLNKTV